MTSSATPSRLPSDDPGPGEHPPSGDDVTVLDAPMLGGVTAADDAAQVEAQVEAAVARIGAEQQLRWFVTFWVLATVVHYTDSNPLDALPMVALGLPVLIAPSSAAAIGVFTVAAAVNSIASFPAPANHKVLNLFVAVAMGVAGLWAVIEQRRAAVGAGTPTGSSVWDRFVAAVVSPMSTATARGWVDTARVPAGLSLLVIYFFTTFDKINHAFLDPATSCARGLLEQLLEKNSGVPVTLPPLIAQGAAVGTLVVEAIILVGVATPRLRRWAVPLGIGFHLMLAAASFWDFSTMVFAVYLLLLPSSVFTAPALRSPGRRQLVLGAFGVHVLLSMTMYVAGASGENRSPFGLQWHTLLLLAWLVAVLPLLVPVVRGCLTDPSRGRGWPGWRPRSSMLLLIPAVVLLNGLAPWLGLKTVAAYSMFSNLHTEQGTTNHVIPGLAALQVFPYARDTVVVDGISMSRVMNRRAEKPAWMKEKPPITVPRLELRRMVADWHADGVDGVRIDYRDAAGRHVATNAMTDPELGRAPNWWQRNLLSFRAVDSGWGHDICRW